MPMRKSKKAASDKKAAAPRPAKKARSASPARARGTRSASRAEAAPAKRAAGHAPGPEPITEGPYANAGPEYQERLKRSSAKAEGAPKPTNPGSVTV
jgi:hypothetical protein